MAIILHWLIATCILFNLSVGFFMEGFAPPARGVWVGLHISSGVSVLYIGRLAAHVSALGCFLCPGRGSGA